MHEDFEEPICLPDRGAFSSLSFRAHDIHSCNCTRGSEGSSQDVGKLHVGELNDVSGCHGDVGRGEREGGALDADMASDCTSFLVIDGAIRARDEVEDSFRTVSKFGYWRIRLILEQERFALKREVFIPVGGVAVHRTLAVAPEWDV